LDTASREIEEAVTSYLRRATETFDLSKNVEVNIFSFLMLWNGNDEHFRAI
jgi:hypothetical protein